MYTIYFYTQRNIIYIYIYIILFWNKNAATKYKFGDYEICISLLSRLKYFYCIYI